MLKKLRRKFVAVVMGVAAVILLAVFAVLVISTETMEYGKKLKIMENEKHPFDDLKNVEITEKQEK